MLLYKYVLKSTQNIIQSVPSSKEYLNMQTQI